MADSVKRIGWRKAIPAIFGAALLIYIAYTVYSQVTGKERMTEVCKQIQPGMPVEQLAAFAKEHGLGPGKPHAGTKLTYLAELRSLGRHACRVELEAGIVKDVAYNYAD
jgi:hypothetical protein